VLSQTRKTVQQDLSMLKRDDGSSAQVEAKAR